MRLILKKPMEIVRTLVREHLVLAWAMPQVILSATESTKLTEIYTDPTFTTRVDLASLRTRVVLSNGKEGARTFNVIAAIGPEIPTIEVMLLLTDQHELIFAMHTEAARHEDGTIQIFGAEPTVVIGTMAQAREARAGRKLLDGCAAFRTFKVEMRDGDGVWREKKTSIAVSLENIVSMTQEPAPAE